MSLDVCVIGAGVIGLSAAHALIHKGADVVLADGGHAGQSSWAGAGIVCPLMPWHYGEEVNRLALAGMQAWPDWARTLASESGNDPEFWVCGMALTEPEDKDAALVWCKAHDFAVENISDNQLWLPQVAQVRNPRLLNALSGAVDALGGKTIQNCKIDGLKKQGRTITAALSGATEYRAETFVLATGAWAGLGLAPLAAIPNVRPVRGQMLLYAPGSQTLSHIIYRKGIYLVPRKDGHLLVGSTLEDAGFDAKTTPDALASLHVAACEMLPELQNHQPIKSWAGLRPGSPDNIPVIDRHPDFDNLWVHTGHFRYGVTMAPASSRLLAELMLGETPFLDPAPYSWQVAQARNWPQNWTSGKPC